MFFMNLQLHINFLFLQYILKIANRFQIFQIQQTRFSYFIKIELPQILLFLTFRV